MPEYRGAVGLGPPSVRKEPVLLPGFDVSDHPIIFELLYAMIPNPFLAGSCMDEAAVHVVPQESLFHIPDPIRRRSGDPLPYVIPAGAHDVAEVVYGKGGHSIRNTALQGDLHPFLRCHVFPST